MELPRPTIEELISRYTLEPTLDDVFVEGAFDKNILDVRARMQADRRITVYEIDSVDVPPEVLAKHGLTDGNKQRVIALGHELALETGDCRYRCIVDKDLDEWLDRIRNVDRLSYTEYCDVEGYYLASPAFKHLVVIVAKAKVSNWEIFLSSLLKALNFFYSVRLCAAKREWIIDGVELRKSISVKGSEVLVEKDSYVLKVLNKNKLAKEVVAFTAEVVREQDALSDRPYHAVRGHDLVEVVAKCILDLKGVKEGS